MDNSGKEGKEGMDAAPEVGTGRSVSFFSSLLRSVVFLVLLLTVAVLGVSLLATRNAVQTLCQDLVVSGVDRLEARLNRFFEPIPSYMLIAKDWTNRGFLEDFDPERMTSVFVPMVNRSPQVSSISTADSDGVGFTLFEWDNRWAYRSVDRSRNHVGVEWTFLTEDGEQIDQKTDVGDTYDPRTRPWYMLATAEDADDTQDAQVFWTEPYLFYTTREPGITVSTRARDPEGKLSILAADVRLSDISRVTSQFEISPRGFAIVTARDGRIVGLPRHPKFDDPDSHGPVLLDSAADLGIPLITVASLKVREHFGLKGAELLSKEQGLAASNAPFRWTHDGMAWWSYVRPCRFNNGPVLWIGVAVPEDDFLGELKELRIWYGLLIGAALIGATLTSLFLARRFNRPIQSLIRQSDRLTKLDTTKVEIGNSSIREITQLHNAQERMRVALDSFARYVPSDVVRQLLDKGEAAVIGGHNKQISILFTDIEGFTSIAESMSATELTGHMASYFEAMIAIIRENFGTVDKLIGDAIVAFWGAPTSNHNHARDAVQAALRCKIRLDELNREWEAQGLPRLPTRFGIATGDVVVGNVGSPERLSYTAIGDSVNLASRLEGANAFYGTSILASTSTVEQAENSDDPFVWRRLDRVRVKGRTEPEEIYELLGVESSMKEEDQSWSDTWEEALKHYQERRFAESTNALEILENWRPGDRSVARLKKLCDESEQHPPPEDWDGVSTFQNKS